MSFLRLHLLLNFSFCGRSLFCRSALVLGMTRDITCDSRHVQGASWTGSVWLSVQIGATLYVCRYGLTYPMDVYKLIYIFSKYSKGKNFLPLQYLRLSQVSTPADKKCVFFLCACLIKSTWQTEVLNSAIISIVCFRENTNWLDCCLYKHFNHQNKGNNLFIPLILLFTLLNMLETYLTMLMSYQLKEA